MASRGRMLCRLLMTHLLVAMCVLSTRTDESSWLLNKLANRNDSLQSELDVNNETPLPKNANQTNNTTAPEISNFEKSKLSNSTNELPVSSNSSGAKILETLKESISDSKDSGILNNKNFLNRLLNSFDRHTLIMVIAFLIGSLLIGCLITISICICNGLNESSCSKNQKNKASTDLATNPAYDVVQLSDSDNFNKKVINDSVASNISLKRSEEELLINKISTPKNSKDNALVSTSSSLSCSSASINSVVFKTPNSIEIPKLQKTTRDLEEPKTPRTINKNQNNSASNIRSSLSNIANKLSLTPSKNSVKINEEKSNDSENERSCLLDEMDNSDLKNDSLTRKPIFQPLSKTGQQMLREKNISNRNVPSAYNRTQSESFSIGEDSKIQSTASNNRLSAASSRSSILTSGVPLNFDQIKGDIDDLAVNNEQLVSRTNLQESIHISTNDIISDIYMKEMLAKHKKSNQNDADYQNLLSGKSVSSSSIISNKNSKGKRFSVNIDVSQVNFDPNPGQSTTNLDKNPSVSVCTLESEKSCY